ncbi:hypothetical protein [Caldivirga sp. UBA161]|uniref:hypothetical protein n=1 Tax=Caldivirga sp. UBA161 TaxID=1915569 RepID=UPI0025BCB59A|nr:hypothetical protein [Caldivirga sp. UBA161]
MQGVALFEVHGDKRMVYFDLSVVGLSQVNVEESQFEVLNEVENELHDLVSKYGPMLTSDVGLEYNDWPTSRGIILARLYMKDTEVKLVLLASYERSLISKISNKLSKLGWRPIFVFDIRKIIKSTRFPQR